ncbi:MAG: hypothetical protein P9M15_02695 [Candidatus Electryoneaceae bacterium]|nr:hypothetical protein [Candidatus Electryoneaceae bacterium]
MISSRLFIVSILAIAVMTFSPSSAIGQHNVTGNATGIGASVGLVGGTGFSVRMLPASGLGYHVSGFYIKTTNEQFVSVGVEPLFVVRRTNFTTAYILGGVGYLDIKDRQRWSYGLGFGYGWRASEYVWISTDLLLTSYNKQVLPYPQLALHYYIW